MWLEIINNNEGKSRTELKQVNNSLYSWLHKNDKIWFYDNLPEVKVRNNSGGVVDWDKRDKMILEKVKCYIEKTCNTNEKPLRITRNQIIKNTNISKNSFRELHKIPKTKSYLDDILEDEEKFIRRKVKWAIKTIQAENSQLNKNSIKRKVNVNKKYSDLVNEIIIEELK